MKKCFWAYTLDSVPYQFVADTNVDKQYVIGGKTEKCNKHIIHEEWV